MKKHCWNCGEPDPPFRALDGLPYCDPDCSRLYREWLYKDTP